MENIQTKEQIVDALKAFAEQEYTRELNHQVEDLKSEYYKISKELHNEALNTHIENGGEKNEFEAPEDSTLEAFKALMESHKARREAFNTALAKKHKDNKEAKKKLLAELKELTEKEDINKDVFEALKQIQEKWNEVKELSSADEKELWGEYNYLRDVFYSHVKINSELRELDFQKNLDAKKALVEKVEALAAEEDIKKMNDDLQFFHEQWREIGPVKREISEELWQAFSEASKLVHKKRQDHYDALYAQEEVNAEKKESICAEIAKIEFEGLNSVKEWSTVTEQLMKLQADYKAIGFAGKTKNQEVWEKYRALCDAFFHAKSNYFSQLREKEDVVKAKKIAIIEKAEALKDSEDWQSTSKTLIQLQKEWKQVGDAGRNAEFKLWKRFRAACDAFFDKKSAHFDQKSGEEKENLAKKEAIIEKMKAFELKGDKASDLEEIKAFSSEWNAIGHVPFKAKDKVYKTYKDLLDGFFDSLNLADTERMMTEFKSKFSEGEGGNNEALDRERKKLRRQLNEYQDDLKSMEMNMALISKSKSADLFRMQVEKNKEKVEQDIAKVKEKLALLKEIANA